MVSSIIDSSVTSIPNFFSITSGDSLLVTKNGALFSPLGGYGFGGLTNVLVDCAGYINLESLGFSSGGIMTIETGGVYSGNSLTASLIFTGGVSFTNMGSASFRMDGVLSRGGNFLANTGTVTAVGTDFILNHAGTNFDQLVNDGTVISRNAFGVQVESGTANITNHGTIEALGSVNFGSNIGIYAGGNTTITNSGTITGTYAGVQSSFVSTADVTVLSNDGTITGFNYSYVGGAGLSFV